MNKYLYYVMLNEIYVIGFWCKNKTVIFCGVRSKYCYICQLVENRDEVAQDHVCFKN